MTEGKTPATFNPANPQQYLKQGGSILSLSDEPDLFEKSERERIVKLSDINTDVDLFQNREGEFSQETVDSIKQAVYDGTFDWVEFDAIMIWKNPKDNKYYVLAGHSRLQAAKELKNEGHEEFGALPAKIKKGTLEEAQEFARTKSNIMGTKESDIARAKVYRRMREEGKKESEIIEAAKKNEGKNWVLIHNISALNPDGKSIATLRQFEQSSDIEMRSKAEAVADWVGEARNKYRELSDTHEAEIYEYLWSAYSKKKAAGKITNKTAFIAMLEMVIDRAKAQDMFHPEVSLNIKGAVGKSDLELEYDSEIAALIKAEKEARSTLDEKRADLLARGATREDMDRILPGYEAMLQKAITELSEARSRKGLVKTAARQQTDIFSQIEEAPLTRIKVKLLQFAELLTGKPINRELVRMEKGGEMVGPKLKRYDTRKHHFDFLSLDNRRFGYNPKTSEIIFGDTGVLEGAGISGSHAEEIATSGAKGDFDDFVRGWVSGTSAGYPGGIIHFAPHININHPTQFNIGWETMELFKRNGANKDTIVRGFGTGEKKLGELFISSLEKGGKITETMKLVTKYYKIEHDTTTEYLRFLKELKQYVEEAKLFDAAIGQTYFIIRGYYETSPYPTESEDFHDIITKYYNYKHTTLSSKPNPEQRWHGKWKTITEQIQILDELIKPKEDSDKKGIKSKLLAFADLITSEAEKSRNALPGNEQKFVDKLIADTKAGITYNKPKLEKLATEHGIKEQNLAKELAELAVVIMAREIALNDYAQLEPIEKTPEAMSNGG